MTAKETRALYERAIKHYGEAVQIVIVKALEEFGELIQAISKGLIESPAGLEDDDLAQAIVDHINEEMADAQIMLEQLTVIFKNESAVLQWKDRKLDRLKERLDAHERDEV